MWNAMSARSWVLVFQMRQDHVVSARAENTWAASAEVPVLPHNWLHMVVGQGSGVGILGVSPWAGPGKQRWVGLVARVKPAWWRVGDL
jgi:hypothetical protein